MFECLVGYPPFCSESTHDTYQKIINWSNYLMFPDDVHLSHEAEDLIKDLEFGVCLEWGGDQIPEDENDVDVKARARLKEELKMRDSMPPGKRLPNGLTNGIMNGQLIQDCETCSCPLKIKRLQWK